jgi:dTDP-4-dehydrorhamnose reductase
VHISSDAVHAGRPTPYPDDAVPGPVTAYGAAKAAAETAVAAIDPSAIMIRTSLIIGDDRSKQVRLALDLINGTVPGALFTDGGLGPRPADVRLDSTRAAALLTTRLRGAHEILGVRV